MRYGTFLSCCCHCYAVLLLCCCCAVKVFFFFASGISGLGGWEGGRGRTGQSFLVHWLLSLLVPKVGCLFDLGVVHWAHARIIIAFYFVSPLQDGARCCAMQCRVCEAVMVHWEG
ncbi:hypothetical protein B0T16DRAFT_34464 [Cercophora newfieldiana]|uniref:Uncharacterized protein n=1 Tax=Cercophora newfieldiana TaxID=92897 RepID=A0AA39YPI7_9PEZI|nr:hypothetical protein B0T16DRAFT_34464 [Cercophora newfieldiana]